MSASEVQHPIINSPYEEPACHWKIHEHEPAEKIDGRRMPTYMYLKPGTKTDEQSERDIGYELELSMVSSIRRKLAEWRPLALARQRLLTATYPCYQLKDEKRGPGGGFVYARKQNKKGEQVGGIVPHITLKSIANNEPPAEEVLVDKPEVESNVTRISGPFCVEAVLPIKNIRSSQIFSVCGLPDVALRKADEKADNGGDLYQVELRGLDIFDPISMETDSCNGDDVPCWMLDPDYDGQCFRAGQVFFPRTGAWDKIRKAVKSDFEDTVWEHLAGAVSAPFIAGEQVAVKVIDDRGNELMVVKRTTGEN